MPATRLGKLIQLLHQRTEERKIVWDETIDENVYQAAFPNYTVQLGYKSTRGTWGDEEIIYFIKILEANSRIIEEATDIDLNSELENSHQEMENLYKSARRQAMGLDKALDSILSELENNN